MTDTWKFTKGMWTLLVVTGLCLGMIGCTTKNTYREGDLLSLGAYIPWETSLYGVEIFQKLNGISVSVKTNTPFSLEREYVCTNSYFGIIQVNECSKTKVEVETK